jgi:hypothetical protein
MFRPIWPSSGVSTRVSAPSAMQWSASASGFGRGVFYRFLCGFLVCMVVSFCCSAILVSALGGRLVKCFSNKENCKNKQNCCIQTVHYPTIENVNQCNRMLKFNTMLQAGRSRNRVPMWWIFQFTESFQPHYGPAVDSASNRNEYQDWGVKGGRRVRLTTLPPSVI